MTHKPPKHCFDCDAENSYKIHIKDITHTLSENRTLFEKDAESFKCSECGAEILNADQCDKTESLIRANYPDYYQEADKKGLERKMKKIAQIPQKTIELAQKHAILQAEHTKPEYVSGIAICLDENGEYHMFNGNAWTKPSEEGFMVWSAPKYRPFALVDKDGKIKPYED